MKRLFTEEEYKSAKTYDKLPLKCYRCEKEFYQTKHYIYSCSLKTSVHTGKYCSKVCAMTKVVNVECKTCGKKFLKFPNQIKKSKSGNHFCSNSCAATYNNKHKKTGTKRSKLEVWVEEQLLIIYPNIEIHFNRKDTISSELDIYIPSLSLAIELNGIFHYEPIFGEKKLKQTKNNDERKFQACLEKNIEFAIIDTSQQKYFKPKSSQKYLNIITEIINNKLKNI